MLIEDINLTMSHVGLGDLSEYGLMVLFGNAHSHQLVDGLAINPSQITAGNGDVLYPAYFMTRLKVPLTHLLDSFKLWQTVSVGVDVQRFGETLLESQYVLGHQGQVNDDVQSWSALNLPTMQGNNLIVNEGIEGDTAKRPVSNPAPQKIASLVKSARAPAGLGLSRKIRSNGFDDFDLSPQFANSQPIIYTIKPFCDVESGHALIFAKYAQIMDVVEHDFLSQDLFPALSDALLDKLSVVERDIYYYGNCYAGEALSINLCGEIELADDNDINDDLDFIAAGYLVVNFEIYQARTRTLLAMSRVKKVFAIPMKDQEIIADLRRLLLQH